MFPHRPLVHLLQSPAHRVVRVLQVTQSHWGVPERGPVRGPGAEQRGRWNGPVPLHA